MNIGDLLFISNPKRHCPGFQLWIVDEVRARATIKRILQCMSTNVRIWLGRLHTFYWDARGGTR